MKSIHVYVPGINYAEYRYYTSSGIDDVWYKLLIYYFCGGICDALGLVVNGISQ